MMNAIYLGGEFIETNEVFSVTNPFNGNLIAKCSLAGKNEIQKAIDLAVEAKKSMFALSSAEKYELLMSINNELLHQKNEFAEIIALECAKPLPLALVEVERAAETFKIAAEESKRLPSEYLSLDWTPPGKNREGLVKYFPIGVVAGIAPFNFPLNLTAHKIAPAIAAGCPIILKPSSNTPLTALKLAHLFSKTNLPKGGLSVLPCNRTNGQLLVTDDRISLLSFTGSDQVGWKMKNDCGKKKIVLELGGNAAVYLHNDADLTHAIPLCAQASFNFSGQVCIHVQRIYAHASVFDKVVTGITEYAQKLTNENPLVPTSKFSVMIDENNAIRVEKMVNDALADGAKLIYGGKRNVNYFEPTILTNTNINHEVLSNEVFGPVVCIEKVNDEQEAFQKINDSRYGLQAGIFTNQHSIIRKAFNCLEVGGVIVNHTPSLRFDHMPYGGIKDSGIGREGVAYAIKEMLEPRILVQ